VIAVGLAIELIAAVGMVVGLVLGEPRASALLLAAIAAVVAGLVVVVLGVRRARPPRRGATAVPLGPWLGATRERPEA
jgi:hypothetical protein